MPINQIYPIYLIGMMGVWKSTIGKLLAEKLCCNFIDTDREVESEMSMLIDQIFQYLGEKKFRAVESKVLLKTNGFNGIVSTGGGILVENPNRQFLKDHCTIFLRATPETLAKRIHNLKTRPLLQNSNNMVKRISDIWKDRKEFFESTCSITLDTDDLKPEDIVNLIIDKLK